LKFLVNWGCYGFLLAKVFLPTIGAPCDTTSAYFNQIRLNLARLLQDEVVQFSHDLPLPGIKKKNYTILGN